MSARAAKTVQPASQAVLKKHYLTGLRQRFKWEINRMTSGAMGELLAERPDAANLSFLMSYLYGYHWLRHNVHPSYLADLLVPFRRSRGFLMDLLLESEDAEAFVRGYIDHWLQAPADAPVQRAQLLALLESADGDPERLTARVVRLWQGLGLLTESYKLAYSGLAREERQRYGEMLNEADRERLALLDGLPDPGGETRFAKLGLIPAMGCPQTCRHCMFIWRPPVKQQLEPQSLYQLVDGLTESVLFTGGDLTRHLDHFYAAIRSMRHIRQFAILLNGDFADNRASTERVFKAMQRALKDRPVHWPDASLLLQISFDEFHQEVVVDKRGALKERIPVAKIANIVETAPHFKRIQLCLLHKQTSLNFSMELFQKGVFGRLLEELRERGQQVQLLSSAPSPRLKRNPLDSSQQGQLIKDASFVLARHPQRPILLTSSTIDAYGRAELLEAGEFVKEHDLLQQVLQSGPPPGESFDTDLMFWFNGWVTLFNAVHISLGNLQQEGAERILARHRKDPLSAALQRFDRRLLEYYAEIRDDLQPLIDKATGPHHLFHMLTEQAEARLHLTRRLLGH
ncbi:MULTISPECIES: radical SAM protein [sulfur-oxidizing symbionts]|jgi:hypothetical protein|uniref:Radical SAM domain protein n=2 Tax=sulfur-oxidizing symbionts TaxID=32036 RepID=G2FJ13_9GAMM|nr:MULTISPECIES: radical SAM protein [sulfur-oxidizing symbionts]EGV50788.1 hypothetical protein Rifp1Sym_cj00120 [endosymbiont of Riftia pachyptila (vent Ph05)]EGW53215.1 hypothetical protein TevJSym_bi00190 [endosymbiont of Tevnia jerichonana (vent Tica)]